MKKLAALLAALPLAGCIGVADAGALVDLSIIDRSTGQQLQFHRHHGRLYVVGTPGNRYAVRLRNKSAGRVLTVVSVDGVNALNGQTAATAQSGYVLSAWQSAEIAGWRKSMDEVAAFYFTSVADSYAGRSDRPQNVGVIGIAVYREALPPPVPSAAVESPSRDSANADERQPARPAAKAAAPARDQALSERADSRLGTGHGERIDAPTRYTAFRRASDSPSEVLTIYYDSRRNLLAQGIIPPPKPRWTPDPVRDPVPYPFPGGFTPDPRG